MHDHNGLQVIVEAPIPAVRLIRVAGRLDQAAAASVLRLVAVQLDLIAGRHQAVTDLVLDIEQVRCFEPGGLESLRHAPYTAGQRGIGVCLSGCQGRVAQLPLRARRLLSGFRTFPTAEVALQMLITGTSATSTVERGAHVGSRGAASRPAAADPTPRSGPATDMTTDRRLPDRAADSGRGHPGAAAAGRGSGSPLPTRSPSRSPVGSPPGVGGTQ